MTDVLLEGTIWFYKKKDATILMKYALTIDKSNEDKNQFVLFDDNDFKKQTIKLKHIEKLSLFKDHSWEMEIKGKKVFRFKGITEDDNAKIYDIINKIINQKIDDVLEYFSGDQDMKNEYEDGSEIKLWSVKIDPDLTSSNLLNKFSIHEVYILKFDNDKIVLESKSKTINLIVIPFNVIRRFGNTDFCLGIELGRSSPVGSGVIALRSKNYHSKHMYKSLREQLADILYRLAFRRSDNEINDGSGSETDSSLNWVPHIETNKSRENLTKDTLDQNSFTLKNGNKPKTNSPSISPLVEKQEPPSFKKKVNFLNEQESDETDESDYHDKYIPKYMSSKKMLSASDEFFVDEDNSVYGRVKL